MVQLGIAAGSVLLLLFLAILLASALEPMVGALRSRLPRARRAVVAVVYLVLQIVEGNVLLPMVMRNTIGISPLLVLVGLLVGPPSAVWSAHSWPCPRPPRSRSS